MALKQFRRLGGARMNEPTIESLQERIAQLEAEAKIECSLN